MDHSSVDRRTVLRGAAVTGGVVALGGMLSACAPQGSGGAGAGSGSTASGSVAASKVPVGGGIVLPAQNVVITQPTEGEYKAFDGNCAHQGCPVSEVNKDGIKCPCHNGYFDPANGDPIAGPPKTPLAPITCRLEGDQVVFGK